jgi:hypothetical protein
MATQKTNVIIGTITHHKYRIIKPFFSSLRATGYPGDIVLFHSNVTQSTIHRLRQWGVILVPFRSSFPPVQSALVKHLVRWANEKRLNTLDLSCLRYLLAYCYLKEFPEKYRHVMLSDIRDVIFQKDPFNFAIDGKLCCFLEREGVSLGQQPENARWLELAFDKRTLERLSDRPIVCSGITIGPTNLIIDYLEKMADLFMRAPGQGWQAGQSSAQTWHGMDQPVHNYLVFNGLLPACKLFPNDGGPVLTVGIESGVTLNHSKLIINKRGDVPNIVHQYDRHWNVAKRYYSFGRILSQRLRILAPKLHRFLVTARDTFSQ